MNEMNRKFVGTIGINIWAVVFIILSLYGREMPIEAFLAGVGSLGGLMGADAFYDFINSFKGNVPALIEVTDLLAGVATPPKNEIVTSADVTFAETPHI